MAAFSPSGRPVDTGLVNLPDAPLSRRVVARIIDVLLAYIPAFCLVLAVGDDYYAKYIATAVPLVFLLLADGFREGQSPGKKLCGLRVVARKTGLPCGPLRSIVRNLFLIDFLIVFAIIIDVVLWSADQRRLGDVVAGTRVVDLYSRQPVPDADLQAAPE